MFHALWLQLIQLAQAHLIDAMHLSSIYYRVKNQMMDRDSAMMGSLLDLNVYTANHDQGKEPRCMYTTTYVQ